jgi:hypothetical protein
VITMRSLITVLVVGCGSSAPTTDIAPTLRFADRSDAEINALICGAATDDFLVSDVMLSELGMSTCPSVQGDTLVGGCTTVNGTAITGSVARSYAGTRFDALTITTKAASTVTWNGSRGFGNSPDLTVEREGISVREQLNYTCVDLVDCEESNTCRQMCTSESSGVELVDVGGALVSGTWKYDAMPDPHLVDTHLRLVGEDTLTAVGDVEGSWQVGSRSGRFACPSPEVLY